MKNLLMTFICAMLISLPVFSQGLNDKADSKSKVRVTRNPDKNLRNVDIDHVHQ